eukprot:5946669-Amphidinium_carterae.1
MDIVEVDTDSTVCDSGSSTTTVDHEEDRLERIEVGWTFEFVTVKLQGLAERNPLELNRLQYLARILLIVEREE